MRFLPASRKLAAHDQFTIDLDAALLKHRTHLTADIHGENALDNGGFATLFDKITRDPFARQGTETVYNDRFSRARFARQKVQPAAKLDDEILDEGDILDLEQG